MIVSVSRRTDIPAHFSDWFFRRLRIGWACSSNPMNPKQVRVVSLRPQDVDGFVFWTKNPIPMLDRLPLLAPYPYYFQFTLTSYGRDLEPGLPSKNDVLVPAFQQLARMLGPDRVIWRYDPIILTPTYTAAYHLRWFEALAKRLEGCTRKCVISFVDDYRHLAKTARALQFQPIEAAQMQELAAALAAIAARHGMRMESCAEAIDLSACGIEHGRCIDAALLSRIAGRPIEAMPDRNQRGACGCAASVDIGMYDSCLNGCRYCYANHSPAALQRNLAAHDPNSPLLYGQLPLHIR